MMQVLKTRQPVPDLTVPTLDGPWSLAAAQPRSFTLLVFYRGLHCPICRGYLQELGKLLGEFEQRGVEVLALSSDLRERALQAREDWGLGGLRIGHDLSTEQARAWGLHRSAGRGRTSIGIEEPAEFSEPAIYLVRPDGSLYWGNVSTMPFARPHFREILGAIDFVQKNDYPARGELS